jgi:hypothetical protein
MKKIINGYYAKLRTGKTLYEFEWSEGANSKLFLILDDKTKKEVNPNDYDIFNVSEINADTD